MRVLMTGVTGYAGFHAAIAGGDINDASSYRDLLEQCQSWFIRCDLRP